MTKSAAIAGQFGRSVLGNYTRAPVAFVRGRGSWLWDADGKKYLDFFPGFGAGALGHCHPAVVRAIRLQAGKLIHVQNLVMHPWQARLAGMLLRLAKMKGRAFFCNSGAEANEAAIKLARRYHQIVRGEMRSKIVCVTHGFHGRTMGALAATGTPAYHKGFAPMPRGFVHVPLNDLAAAKRAIDRKTAAFLVEPIQGEAGVRVADAMYLRALRAMTKAKGALLMFDEVQSGCGRTGEFLAAEAAGVHADVITLAKPLAGGLPMGAMLVHEKFSKALPAGSHGTTFGGSPLVCAAGIAAVTFASEPKNLARVRKMGLLFRSGLESLRLDYPDLIAEVRGRGLMLGLQLSVPGKDIATDCRNMRLLINCTHDTVLRTMPAMVVTPAEIRQALAILDRAFAAERTRRR